MRFSLKYLVEILGISCVFTCALLLQMGLGTLSVNLCPLYSKRKPILNSRQIAYLGNSSVLPPLIR